MYVIELDDFINPVMISSSNHKSQYQSHQALPILPTVIQPQSAVCTVTYYGFNLWHILIEELIIVTLSIIAIDLMRPIQI